MSSLPTVLELVASLSEAERRVVVDVIETGSDPSLVHEAAWADEIEARAERAKARPGIPGAEAMKRARAALEDFRARR